MFGNLYKKPIVYKIRLVYNELNVIIVIVSLLFVMEKKRRHTNERISN